jgi:hypothetical protein
MNNVDYYKIKKRVEGFFNNEVAMYILPDLERLTDEIRPDPKNGQRGCTIPLAMMIFGVIDLFGYLMRNNNNAKKTETYENFKYLFSKRTGFFPNIYDEKCDMMVKLFRHGLIHQFFPKASGILKAEKSKPLIFCQDGIPNLNVDVLANDLKVALEKMKKYVEKNEDPELVVRINERLDKLSKEDYEALEEFKNPKIDNN